MIENNDALQSKNWPGKDQGCISHYPQSEFNHRGEWCFIQPGLLCQEGYCSECYIFTMKIHGFFKH